MYCGTRVVILQPELQGHHSVKQENKQTLKTVYIFCLTYQQKQSIKPGQEYPQAKHKNASAVIVNKN